MPKTVGPSPGHRALLLLRRLVALYDQNPIARQYVKTSGDLFALEREARAILSVGSMPTRALNGLSSDGAPCTDCWAIHEVKEDEREAVRS